jgi:ATP-dependent DNA helicase RecG
MTIDQLKQLKESEDRIEFKEAKHNFPFAGGSSTKHTDRRKCFLGYITALANEGGGKLVFGMTDAHPHVVVGSDFGIGRMGAIVNDTLIHLGVRIHYDELYEETRRVLVVHVPSRPIGRLMKFEGIALMRTGDSLRNMTDDEMFHILSENEPDFSAKICNGLCIEDLDEIAIILMKEAYSQKQMNPAFKALPTSQILSDLKLLVNGKLNYAALILLGKKDKIEEFLPNAKVIWEFRYYESSVPYEQRHTIVGPLYLVINDIWKLVNAHNGQTTVQIGAYIFGILNFNETVIREAVLNAIAHRDYTISSEVVIKQYPQRIIINNPGGFPKGVNIDNLLTVSSTPRCRLMSEIMEKTGLVERSGQGIDKIFSITLSEGKSEPDYSGSGMFQVSLLLDCVVVDKAFYLFLNHSQPTKSSKNAPGINAIIALNKIKKGQFTDINPETINWLIDRQYIKRSQGHSHRYILADEYEQLAKTEQKIGSKYVVREVERVVTALQGKALKIGELEERLTGALNRNQIKYLVNKLFTDEVITAEGSGRGTRYKLDNRFDEIQGSELIKQVITHLRRIISK